MAARVAEQQILNAVVDTVLAHGYDGATTRQIAAAAGVNEVTLFRRYGDKASLVRAAIAHEVAVFGRRGPAYTGHLEADLLRILDFYAAIVQDRGRMLIMLIAEAPRRPELAEVIREPLQVMNEILAMLHRYQASGMLAGDDPTDLATALLGPLLLHTMFARVHPDLASAPFSTQQHLQRFLDGHRTPT